MEIEFDFDIKKVEEKLRKIVTRLDQANKSRELAKELSPLIFRDVIEHFTKEVGPNNVKWPDLTGWYKPWKEKKYPGRPKLVLSGRMRQAFNVGNIRVKSNGYEFYNPVEYSGDHDRGKNGQKKRQFMYLTDEAMQKISLVTAAFVMED